MMHTPPEDSAPFQAALKKRPQQNLAVSVICALLLGIVAINGINGHATALKQVQNHEEGLNRVLEWRACHKKLIRMNNPRQLNQSSAIHF